MKTVVALARCSHFAPTLAVTTFALLIAVSAGRGRDAVSVTAAVLAGQLSVGWSNDWVDRHRDRRAGRCGKPLVRGDVSPDLVIGLAVTALVACTGLSLLSGVQAASAHLVAVTLAWSYNLGLKSTVVSPVPYALAFALLPSFVTLGAAAGAWPPWWALTGGALLGAGAHFANTLPDMEDDAATGVRGLPQRLGPTLSLWLATVLLAGGAATVAVGPAGAPDAAQVVALAVSLLGVAAVAGAGITGRLRLAFPLTLLTAGAVVVAFVAAGAQLTP